MFAGASCPACTTEFASRNQLYKHLRESGECLSRAGEAGTVVRSNDGPTPRAVERPCLPVYSFQGNHIPLSQAAGDGAASPEADAFRLDDFIRWKGVVERLHRVVLGTAERLEGNCLCRMTKKERAFVIEEGKKSVVRRNLFHLAKHHVDSILEVGFNAGHSCALFCYGWDMRDVSAAAAASSTDSHHRAYLAFDLCEHNYARPCFDELRAVYGSGGAEGGQQTVMEFVPGDSIHTLQAFNHRATADEEEEGEGGVRLLPLPAVFDLVHVDGGHTAAVAKSDILLCRRFATPAKTFLLVDDAQFNAIEETLTGFIGDGMLTEVDYAELGLTQTRLHRMFVYN